MLKDGKKNSCKYVKDIWWFNPAYIYFLLMLLVLYAWYVPEHNYSLMYGVPYKVINIYYVLIYFCSALLFYSGFKISKPSIFRPLNNCLYLEKTSNVLYLLCMVAYIVWFFNFAMNFGVEALFSYIDPTGMSSNVYAFRANSGKITGLTSMTEIGVIIAPIITLLYLQTSKKLYRNELILLFVLSLIRSVLFSERLAFLEVFVPFVCISLGVKKQTRVIKLIPVIGVGFIIILFGIFEYVRSWSTYYVNVYEGTFIDFVIDRILGYYSVAINTECTVLDKSERPYFPLLLLQWLWKLPLLNTIPEYIGFKANLGELLETYGNPEFNNPGGLLTGITDFGVFGLLFPYILGLFFGKFYKSFKQASLTGFIIYPICFLCLIELPRYYYFGNNRAFYVLLLIVFVYVKIKQIPIKKVSI